MTLALIAFGVAMDATAVSASYALRGFSRAQLAVLAVTFGIAQMVMAMLGAFGGERLESRIARWDHWVAFVLLAIVGGRMIREAFEDEDDDGETVPELRIGTLLILAIATSIDSLAVGLTLPTIGLPPVMSSVVIGVVTALFSFAGAWMGVRLGERFGRRIEILGGVILIGIGIHVLVDHTLLQ